MRRLVSLLWLATPAMAPIGVPMGGPKAELGVGLGRGLEPELGNPPPAPPVRPGPRPLAATASPGRTIRHLPSLVMGALYWRRRNLPFTRTSKEAGKVLPFLRWYSSTARAIWSPRK